MLRPVGLPFQKRGGQGKERHRFSRIIRNTEHAHTRTKNKSPSRDNEKSSLTELTAVHIPLALETSEM